MNDNKAGMQGLDIEKINEILSKHKESSKFAQKQKQRELRVDEMAKAMNEKVSRLDATALLACTQKADGIISSLEAQKDYSRTIVCIDMDAFYAAVEMRDNPDLKNVPMAVGGYSMLVILWSRIH